VTTVVLPHDGASAGAARHALVRELAQQDVPEPVVDDALLVLSELVGNAVRHGEPLPGGGIQVSWWVAGEAVHVEVVDGGDGLPGDDGEQRAGARIRDPDAGVLSVPSGREGGRGLPIIDLLCARWGTTTRGPRGGVGVYAELPLHTGSTAGLTRGGPVTAGARAWPQQRERRSARPVAWPRHLERRASA
jgi:anti-sigma regulatory factor (Ser/Thr protein kinase)